jgi:hypothetical protein
MHVTAQEGYAYLSTQGKVLKLFDEPIAFPLENTFNELEIGIRM